MTVEVATPLLVGFLLAMVRGAAWLVLAPPFNSKAVPTAARAGLAAALAVPVAPRLAVSAPEVTLPGLLGAVLVQVLAGVTLGFLTALLFGAVQAAGDLIDVFAGFLRSYDALPLDATLASADLARIVTAGVGQFFLAALQIATPLIGVLFLVDVGLGLLTRVSPALNAFSLGFPAKILVTLLVVGLTLPLLPAAVERVLTLVLAAMRAVTGSS